MLHHRRLTLAYSSVIAGLKLALGGLTFQQVAHGFFVGLGGRWVGLGDAFFVLVGRISGVGVSVGGRPCSIMTFVDSAEGVLWALSESAEGTGLTGARLGSAVTVLPGVSVTSVAELVKVGVAVGVNSSSFSVMSRSASSAMEAVISINREISF